MFSGSLGSFPRPTPVTCPPLPIWQWVEQPSRVFYLMRHMTNEPPVRWLYGGRGECQLCGVESPHRAVLITSDDRVKIVMCRDCADEARYDLAGFLSKLPAEPGLD
jgi:hypothetical protein